MDREDMETNLPLAVGLLKALSNESRLLIMCVLNKEGEKSVGELEKIVGLSQSALSQHLARLRKDGLVETRRSAQTIYYFTRNKSVQAILDCLCGIFNRHC
ncbi:MAG: winged helix-turn-helix transcriptional regulator [Rhodospirillales bacterium]|nr:winged helix-turn-helix transcriptional regulator [Alphaproteobacteria bacterium]USO04568.1 MAG: winged helix-turn-helix transcriptional regulator [Rhodospirillales bacterium]